MIIFMTENREITGYNDNNDLINLPEYKDNPLVKQVSDTTTFDPIPKDNYMYSYFWDDAVGVSLVRTGEKPVAPVTNEDIKHDTTLIKQSTQENDILLQQRITDIELQNLEAQMERQLMAQQLADLELSLIGGTR